MAAFFTYNIGQLPKGHGNLFVAALGTLPLVTFLGPSRIAVNLYGYTGGAFRRFFLFPTDPAASLRAGSYASVLLGGTLLVPAAIAWAIFAPRPLDFRVIVMPVINALRRCSCSTPLACGQRYSERAAASTTRAWATTCRSSATSS